ncbi:hypothetical protein A4A49_31488 [Nicotiana attenuata]|uniref:Uncharacterized protein n=1 Tax=Nicotiana attenuata TaxID=49451 RepID=A0A314KPF5_NICAT|nr:hypothetical protein A4A49_31488 [Nicotiana attenuata]
MATAPPFTGGKPPDPNQKMRPTNAHPPQKISVQNSSPIGTDINFGAAITVPKNRLGATNNSQMISGSNFIIPSRGISSTSSGAYPLQNSANFTMGIVSSGEKKISDESQMMAHNVPGVQLEKPRYQIVPQDEENMITPPISLGYHPIPSILSSKSLGSGQAPSARPNDLFISEQIGHELIIGNHSTHPKDHICQVSSQPIKGIELHDHLLSLELSQLAGHGVPVNQMSQNQCQTFSAPQVVVSEASNQILHEPISSKIQKALPISPIGNSSLPSKEKTCEVSSHSNLATNHLDSALNLENHSLAGHSDPLNQRTQNQRQIVPEVQENVFQSSTPILHEPISSNLQNGNPAQFTVLGVRPIAQVSPAMISNEHAIPKAPQYHNEFNPVQTDDHTLFAIQVPTLPLNNTPISAIVPSTQNQNVPPITNFQMAPNSTQDQSHTTSNPPNAKPLSVPINQTPSQTAQPQTKKPTASTSNNNMPKISANFDKPTKKPNSLNQKHQESPMMKIEAWTPLFKPHEDSPIVPVWIVIPELPWHLNYTEVLTPLLSHVGKVLFLELASFQKTRGSVAKVKMQIDLTKDRPYHVWLGYDENQDENGDGQWLEIQYENVPDYCPNCRLLEHTLQTCPEKAKKEDQQNKKIAQKQDNHQNEGSQQNQTEIGPSSKGESQEEWQTQRNKKSKGGSQTKKQQTVYVAKQPTTQQQQNIPKDSQQKAPQSSGISTINPPAPLERSEDSGAQNHPSPQIPSIASTSNICNVQGGKEQSQEKPLEKHEGSPEPVANKVNDQQYENISSDENLASTHNDQLRSLLKGKAHVGSDFSLQSPKSKNKPSQMKRKAMRKQNAGISINEPSEKNLHTPIQNPVTSPTKFSGQVSANKSATYKDPDPDPSLSQPLLASTDIEMNDPNAYDVLTSPADAEVFDKNSPDEDEYRPIISEDEMRGDLDNETDSSEVSEQDHHCDLLINAINGVDNLDEAIPPKRSPSKMRLSPRLTRNRAAGIRTSGALERIKILKKLHKISLIAVLEPFLDDSHLNHFKIQLSMHQATSNNNNKIWIFWDQDINATVLDSDDQQVTLELRHVEAADPFHISVIYAKCKPVLRRPLWDNLRNKSITTSTPWCAIGDFNVIASIDEKIGGLPYQISKSMDFLSVIEDCGFTDLGFYGPRYTWSNGRGPCAIVWKRLDRGLVNDNWLTSYPATTISHLASTGSDHSPLLMEMHARSDSARRYFKFLNCWTNNESFVPLVQSVWNTDFHGNPMWIFHQKIKALSSELSKWSRHQYGDIFQKVKEFEEKVKQAEEK